MSIMTPPVREMEILQLSIQEKGKKKQENCTNTETEII